MATMLNIFSSERPVYQTKIWYGTIGLVALLIFSIITNSLLYFVMGSIGIYFLFLYIEYIQIRFISTIGIMILLNIMPENMVLPYIGAALFTGGLIYVLLRKLMDHQSLTGSPLFIPFCLFIFWSAGIGLFGVISGIVEIEYWYRELLLFAPLFLLPIYYSEMVEADLHAEQILKLCVVTLSVIIFIIEIIEIKQNLSQSFFIFQVATRRVDQVSGALMMFIFLSLAMITTSKRRFLLLGVFFIGVASLILSFSRTAWVAAIMLLPFVVLVGNRKERKSGYVFSIMFLIISGLFLFYGYYNIRAVHLGVLFIVSKISTAGHMQTDLSMYNRFVEWRQILRAIGDSPIIGYGLGATFNDYSWLGGVNVRAGFTHNTYLGVLLKSGIVGMILLYTTYIGYMVKGFFYMRNKLLTEKEQAYMRAGVALMLFLTILGYTGSIFFQRGMTVYVALYWCYYIQIEKKIGRAQQSINSKTHTITPSLTSAI
jgi:O-antigen ligase